MNKEEFIMKVNEYGIDLDAFFIVIGYEPKWMYYTGIYQDNKDWVIYEVNERNEATVVYKGTEKRAFSELYSMLLGRISRKGFVNDSVNKKVIQTSQFYVCDFLQKKYDISKSDAEDTWNYLMYDFHVLNEVKYFALNNKFVPEDDCYRVEGYSAQDIYEKTYLTEIGAYNYLIYLDKHPEQALKDLKNGLPRK